MAVPVVVVGLNEHDAPLELLERVAVSERELPKALALLCDSQHVQEAVLLSTCLRTEVYAVVGRFHDGLADIESFFLSRLAGSEVGTEALEERLVVAYDDAAAEHLFSVAAGIESAVLGEGEVLRQVRHAAERARAERACGPALGQLFRRAVEAGKRARSETGIARGVTSLAHVAVALATKASGASLEGRTAVVAGAGEMGAGIARAFAMSRTAPRIVIANRSSARGAALAEAVGGRAVELTGLVDALRDADLVITATSSGQVLLELEDVATAMRARPARPLVVVDAAVPRDVDPLVGELPGVTLFDLDDLRSCAEVEMRARRGEVDRVRAIVAGELVRYREDSLGRSVAPVVTAFRARAEALRRAELERHRALVERLTPADRAEVESLTRAIVAKLVHEPTVQLKRAAGSPEGEQLVEALRSLFDL